VLFRSPRVSDPVCRPPDLLYQAPAQHFEKHAAHIAVVH
jgi:hypothetical protein